MIILIILIILVLLSFNLFRNLLKNDTTILDDVKLKESEPSNNGFALMLQKDDGTYEQSTSSTWPTDMKFNSELSGCIDINGNKIDNALSFNTSTNSVIVSTNQTAYCYVYFDIKKYCNDNEPLGECLLRRNNEIDSLNDNIEAGLYRYQGYSYQSVNTLVTDNYICFGTSDEEECINDTDKYMYRIIGIDENKQIKVIKETSIGSYMWHSNGKTDAPWPDSDIFKGLNGIEGGYYTNLFVNNSTYTYMEKNSNWYNKIVNYNWKYGDTNTEFLSVDGYTASDIFEKENSWTDTINAKIGLIYLHDFVYSFHSGGSLINVCSQYAQSITWLNANMNSSEWTMTRVFVLDEYPMSWVSFYVEPCGDYNSSRVNYTGSSRPVFFLTSNVEYSSGTGTITDPFLINE